MKTLKVILFFILAIGLTACKKDEPVLVLSADEKTLTDEINMEILSGQIQLMVSDAKKILLPQLIAADSAKALATNDLLNSYNLVTKKPRIAPDTKDTILIILKDTKCNDGATRTGSIQILTTNLNELSGVVDSVIIKDLTYKNYKVNGISTKTTQSVVTKFIIQDSLSFQTIYSGMVTRKSKVYQTKFKGINNQYSITSGDGTAGDFPINFLNTELPDISFFITYDNLNSNQISKNIAAALMYSVPDQKYYQGSVKLIKSSLEEVYSYQLNDSKAIYKIGSNAEKSLDY
jgi:hypothetical protein